MHFLAKRLIDFISLIMLRGTSIEEIPALAHSNFLHDSERPVIHCYGAYEEIEERHPEKDLVIKFIKDNGMKVHASWKGVSITIEGNFPDMGWDTDDGEFGYGGDWWQNN